MNTKAIFHCGGGSNLILGMGRENKLFFSENSSHCQVFSTICQKNDPLLFKKKSLPTQMDIWSPTLFPRVILIFQGVLTKLNFLTKFQHLKKYYIDLMKDPKYEHQSTFALWGRVKLNFRDR